MIMRDDNIVDDQPVQVTLYLNKAPRAAASMAGLLQRGYLVPVTGSVSIVKLLIGLPGFDETYIGEKLQTIFVNGLPVDDVYRLLKPGDTLALSAAMPGLAGAIFRKGGLHGSLRTRPEAKKEQQVEESGYVTVKLFNRVSADTGPQQLRAGICIQGKILARFLDRQGTRILPLLERAEIKGFAVALEELSGRIGDLQVVLLRTFYSRSHALRGNG